MRLNKILKNLIIIFFQNLFSKTIIFPGHQIKQSKYQIKSKSMIMNSIPWLTLITVLMKPQRLTDSMALPVMCAIPSDEPIPLIDQVDRPQCGIQPECSRDICYTHYLHTDINKIILSDNTNQNKTPTMRCTISGVISQKITNET